MSDLTNIVAPFPEIANWHKRNDPEVIEIAKNSDCARTRCIVDLRSTVLQNVGNVGQGPLTGTRSAGVRTARQSHGVALLMIGQRGRARAERDLLMRALRN